MSLQLGRRAMGFLVTACLAAAGGLLLVWAFQRTLIYFPLDHVPSPSDVGLTDVETVTFPTEDGLVLSGWFVPSRAAAVAGTVIVFNGNAANRAYRAPLAATLRSQGFQVLLFDYRGYGGNGGGPTEPGLVADARAARAYLLGRVDVDASRLVYFGESLGAAVAIALAVEHGPAAMVLRSPFTSLVDVGRVHYPFLPVALLLRDRFASLETIRDVKCPVLVIAGDRDRIVPVSQSRRLYDAVRAPKDLVIIAGADHNGPELGAGEEMMAVVVRFLSKHIDDQAHRN